MNSSSGSFHEFEVKTSIGRHQGQLKAEELNFEPRLCTSFSTVSLCKSLVQNLSMTMSYNVKIINFNYILETKTDKISTFIFQMSNFFDYRFVKDINVTY